LCRGERRIDEDDKKSRSGGDEAAHGHRHRHGGDGVGDRSEKGTRLLVESPDHSRSS
jgi:hypothetical protein